MCVCGGVNITQAQEDVGSITDKSDGRGTSHTHARTRTLHSCNLTLFWRYLTLCYSDCFPIDKSLGDEAAAPPSAADYIPQVVNQQEENDKRTKERKTFFAP